MSDQFKKHMRMVPLEVTMMKRVGELKAELTACKAESDQLKAEVERLTADNKQLQNRCDFLEGKQS